MTGPAVVALLLAALGGSTIRTSVTHASATHTSVTRTLRIGGRRRSYVLHLPPAGSAAGGDTSRLPLVIAFHGHTANARALVKESH